jgi:hypothetical protein
MPTARGRRAGITLVSVTKGLDAAITVWGLRERSGVTEQNVLARRVFDSLGLTGGVLLLTALSLAVAVCGIEAAAIWLRSQDGRSAVKVRPMFSATVESPVLVRTLGYGSLGTLWTAVSIHNAAVLTAILTAG